ncbi:uncharacterized protein LOC130677735 [Microplitis mediator]|uniref:uncharacterized protein LOC130677735 n=1 Tax=Microplitis mediator TaxID=375433 RepID=UPI002552C916|nr:uncharacterized protein LOC130677735 [Microplitis mediator]
MEVPECMHEMIEKISAGEPIGLGGKMKRNGKIIETVTRWREGLKAGSDSICALKKSLYGLRQAGVEWHRKLVDRINVLGFNAVPQDKCLLVNRKGECMMYIAIYVDDILLASDNDAWIGEIKKALSKSFETQDLGPVKNCIGIEFERDEKSRVFLRQRQYTRAVFKRFGMDECKPIDTPIKAKSNLVKPERASESEMNKYPYQSLIGALLCLAITTRPDIMYAVNYLSQFNTNYNVEHWKAAKRVLRYLKGTIDYGLRFEQTGLALIAVVDANWGGDSTDRKSYTGYGFILAGSVISWEARKQKTVALSSTEAEYMAVAEATKEALYLKGLLVSLG